MIKTLRNGSQSELVRLGDAAYARFGVVGLRVLRWMYDALRR